MRWREPLDAVVGLVRSREREASERLRAAGDRLAAAEARLEVLEGYLAEYRPDAEPTVQSAGRLLAQRRFYAQLEQTVAAQSLARDRDLRQLDQARQEWSTVRRRREAIEERVAARQRRARDQRERRHQQALDDRHGCSRPGWETR